MTCLPDVSRIKIPSSKQWCQRLSAVMKLALLCLGIKCLLVGYTLVLGIPKTGAEPGIRLRITRTGLRFAADRGIADLVKSLKGRPLKDINGRTKVGFVGKIEYKLFGIRNQNIAIPVSSFTTVPGLGLRLQASQIDISFAGKWRYKKIGGWIRLSDEGTFQLQANGVAFDLTAAVGRSSDGRPTIATVSCSASVDEVKVQFGGGASWLYNLFLKSMKGELKRNVQKLICAAAETAINQKAADELKTFPVQKRVNHAALIDYSFLRDPYFAPHYLDCLLKGEFKSTSGQQPSGIPPPSPFGNNPQSDKMMYIWLSDYTLNTASLVFHKAGLLTKTFVPEDVVDSPISLNTKSFMFYQKLYQLYPDHPMQTKLMSTAAPVFSSDPNGMTVTMRGNASFFVVVNQTSLVPVFTLGTGVVCGLTLGVSGSNFTVHADTLRFDFDPPHSNIGNININVQLLQLLANQVLSKTLLNHINKYGDVGFPLPTVDKLSLVNPQVTSGSNFTLIAADLE